MATETPTEYPSDVQIVDAHGRQFVLVGTAHISQESVELVREVIEKERPDCVCIELDEARFEALSNQQRWEGLDLREVIRKRQLAHLLANLLLASYQKRLGLQLGVTPGSELLEAAKVAEECDIPISLCDRDIRITLRRAWHALSWWKKIQLIAGLGASAFDTPELSEEDLREIKKRDVLSELMKDLGDAMPALKRALIDERDTYLAQKIRETPGDRLVAIVGAGHVDGMVKALQQDGDADLEAISQIPPVSSALKWVGWGVPALIVASIAFIGYTKGGVAAGESALFWFVANAVPSGIGALVALGHPVTILAAFFSAPFTSLTPVIGAGYVAAFAQVWMQPPTVREFQTVAEDISKPGRWWGNALLRVFLAFLFVTIGSIIGTWVGGIEIVRNLF